MLSTVEGNAGTLFKNLFKRATGPTLNINPTASLTLISASIKHGPSRSLTDHHRPFTIARNIRFFPFSDMKRKSH